MMKIRFSKSVVLHMVVIYDRNFFCFALLNILHLSLDNSELSRDHKNSSTNREFERHYRENFMQGSNPVGKIAEKAVCRRVFLTVWHRILSAELTLNAFLQTVCLAILLTGKKFAYRR